MAAVFQAGGHVEQDTDGDDGALGGAGTDNEAVHGLDHHINAAALFQQVDLGEQQHNQQDGGDRALDALHDEAACAQGFRDGNDVAEGDGAGDQSQEYAGDDAIAQRLQQVALEQAEDHHHGTSRNSRAVGRTAALWTAERSAASPREPSAR